MSFVVDFSCFFVNNKRVVKSLAYCCMNTSESNIFTFKPNTDYNKLSTQNFKLVRYFENNILHEQWSEGDLNISDLKDVVEIISHYTNATFYMTSIDKINFISAFANSSVSFINIQDVLATKSFVCQNFQPVHFLFPRSLLQNVFDIKNILKHNE